MSVLTKGNLGGIQIAPMKDREQYFNYLIYGDPGSGKTRLSGSALAVPEMRPVLMIDMEGGTESLRGLYDDIDVARITNWNDLQYLYNALMDTDHGYRTVIIDSLSETQKYNMNSIMKAVAASNPKMIEEVPSMREWGINLEQMRRFVRAFRDLPVNTIFTALMASEKDDKTGKVSYFPSLSGKLRNEIAGFLDEVFYMYVKDTTDDNGDPMQLRIIQTGKSEQYVAKDRSGRLPMYMADPTMRDIYDLMKSE